MSEVVSQWILHRLGIIIDMTPENFATRTSNGHLLAQILQSYEIITPEELSIIKESDQVKDSYDNFQHINLWLRHMDLTLSVDDLYEIVHGVGSTSLHLFFQVFLHLKDRTKLDFLSGKELDIQLEKNVHRFCVKSVEDSQDPNKFDLHKEEYCEPLLAGGDVYHWYKNRIENLQIKCKDVRDEYIHNVKNRCKSLSDESGIQERDSAFVLARGLTISPRRSNVSENPTAMHLNDDLRSPNLTNHDNLVEQQKNVLKYQVFNPDVAKANIILKKLRAKSKVRLENRILRNQLHQQIMNSFDTKINDNKSQSAEEVLKDVFMQQSLYEKDLVTKLGQIKIFKEYMLENNFQQTQILNKQKEKAFVDQLILKNKELNETEITYYFERERQLQLHKEIWKEKLRLRQKRNEEMCSNILSNIIDMSLKISEYKKQYGAEAFRRKMEHQNDMFRAAQSVFDISESSIGILKGDEFDIPEEIVTRETFKENALDDQEFDRYMKFEWPWELKNVNIELDMFNHITWGLNVLGYMVHRALSIKYPIVPLWEKPEFPECSVRVCINDLNDTSILPNLSSLLSKREIRVIQLSETVDFCIEAYENESKQKYDQDVPHLEASIDLVKKIVYIYTVSPAFRLHAMFHIKHDKEERKIKKGSKSKRKNRPEREGGSNNSLTNIDTRLESKFVQTPLKFPCEEIPYTYTALLGRTAQDLLNEGQPLGNFLLIDMFVEYLKSIPTLKGWVLVNYPSNFEQATILEEAFSGTKLLDPNMRLTAAKSLTDITEYAESLDKDDCSLYNDAKRISKVLPNPLSSEQTKNLYDTILTAYIRIKKLSLEDRSGDSALPPTQEDLDAQPDPLEEFYSNAGANYSLYYKEFDSSTVKSLAKLIIGDYSLPLKSSLELFGDIGNLDRQPSKRVGEVKMTKKGEKLKKPKRKINLESSTNVSNKTSQKADKKGTKGKSKVSTLYENKQVQVPSEDEEDVDLSESAVEVIEAGQESWQYTKMDCPEELLIALATLWENVEEIYINDLKQVFFLKRINLGLLMPFVQHVKDIMSRIINRPDYRSLYLSKFQKAFNSFEMSYRMDDEFKTEMYCRIEDFKENLVEMSDIKMMESENLRCRIINANWTPCQLTELINIYINMIQIEMDRFIDSVRLINDYFLGLIAEMPTEEENYEEEPIPKYHGINCEAVNSMLRDMSSIVDLSQFDELLSSVVQKVHSCTKKMNGFVANIKEKIKASQIIKPKSKTKSGSPKSEASKSAVFY
ncbi:hypothetical protein HUJ04_006997 [Dendroctonus ponderosae]|nr:hypothetical protein HUJ04_006997 [Dendroctonus ponderosae]